MAMTRKHYELIAEAIRKARQEVVHQSGNNPQLVAGANAGFYELAVILSNEFYMDNDRFDENKFMVATEVLHN